MVKAALSQSRQNEQELLQPVEARHTKTASARQGTPLTDHRPQSAQLQRLAALAHNSVRTAQFKAQQAVMDGIGNTNSNDIMPSGAVEKSNNTGLPHHLKTGIESLSGMSMDHVNVNYNSAKPAQLNAHAYAQGSEIHLAPGQERHLPHEAWHVVQQAQGRVAPTLQMKQGVAINDNAGLEQEADVMGAKALAVGSNGQSAAAPGLVQKTSAGTQAAPIQRYEYLQEDHLKNWVTTHLLPADSDFNQAAQWLNTASKSVAKKKRAQWKKELTSAAWKKPNVHNTGEDSLLSTMRARFEVKDLKSSKYDVVSNQEARLTEDAENAVDDDDVHDSGPVHAEDGNEQQVEAEATPHGGILVSAPLYAKIEDFPQRYLNGVDDPRHFAFVLAYNAHGLTRNSGQVENAVGKTIADPYFRGVALGFYWEQKLYDKVAKKDVWTSDDSFIKKLDKATKRDEAKKESFAKSLRHKKVLGTFPYGMWRNIAMNSQSIGSVMDSSWGAAHAPVMAHVTDPDATTWVDPFSEEHVAVHMARQANPEDDDIKHVVKGSYVYAPGGTVTEDDSADEKWDKHVHNIAHTASILDALLRPALRDQVELSYPAERNLMIRLKGVANEVSLYSMPVWQAKTNMELGTEYQYSFNGKKSAFGLKDAEGRKLEKSVLGLIHDARTLVTSAAVTTEVPARVKSSIAFEAYSGHQQTAGTGGMKAASNVKESLLANGTTEMMRRPESEFSLEKKMAYAEFRDRPRRLWKAVNDAKTAPHPTADSVVDKIGQQVDRWRTPEDAEHAFASLLADGDNYLAQRDLYIAVLRDNYAPFYQFSGNIKTFHLDVLMTARNQLSNTIPRLDGQRKTHARAIDDFIEQLGYFPEGHPGKDGLMAKLIAHRHYYTKSAVDQITLFQDILLNIKKRTG
jgi:hypothetical protein